MIKKLKKKFIVKDEEGGELGKYSNQEDENIEIEQQINVEENKVSKSEVKEIEPEEDALPVELNQGVEEDVKKQKKIPIRILYEEHERSLSNEARVHITNEARVHTTDKDRVHSKLEIHTHSEQETVS